ncbi:MAG TPA: ATP-binding protein [Chloroflexia bacterium]|nr:ATP-binding protein [Chloroflexia bacterium]
MSEDLPVIVAWSGGKDSTLALARLPPAYHVVALLTHLDTAHDRVSVHGTRHTLIERQAAALGLPVQWVPLPPQPTNLVYEAALAAALAPYQAQGVRHIVYGDLFLADIRQYRDAQLARLGWQGVYPLWGLDTQRLLQEFIAAGFRAVLTCVDTTQLACAFAGRAVDPALLASLPPGCDPCGENGEFHTFVHDGPLFRWPVPVIAGAGAWQVGRFCYYDLEVTPDADRIALAEQH